MDNVIVRNATIADTTAAFHLLSQLTPRVDNENLFAQLFEVNLSNPEIIYLVAESEHAIVGFISCHGQLLLHHMGKAYEIQEMYVDEAYRSKGVGKMLLQHLESIVKELEYDVIEVTSSHKREGAHAFYMANGYEFTHRKFTKNKQ